MTQTIRFPALAGAIAAALCLATLTPSASREAVAQGIRVSVPIQTHYGSGYNRYSGYGSGRYGVGGYSGFRSSGYSGYGYGGYGGYSYRTGAYGAPSRTYSGYGNGPYGYGSVNAYPSYSYGYRTAPSYNLQYRGLQYQRGSYRPLYNPSQSRFYSPYGYDRY